LPFASGPLDDDGRGQGSAKRWRNTNSRPLKSRLPPASVPMTKFDPGFEV